MIGLHLPLLAPPSGDLLLRVNFADTAVFPASGAMSNADFLAATGITHTGTTLPTFSGGGLVLPGNSDDQWVVPESKVVSGGGVGIAINFVASTDRSSAGGNIQLWNAVDASLGTSNVIVNPTLGVCIAQIQNDREDPGLNVDWDIGTAVALFQSAGGGVVAYAAGPIRLGGGGIGFSSHAGSVTLGNVVAGNTYRLMKGGGTSNFPGTVTSIRAYRLGVRPF